MVMTNAVATTLPADTIATAAAQLMVSIPLLLSV
jgi:hypothetical protein